MEYIILNLADRKYGYTRRDKIIRYLLFLISVLVIVFVLFLFTKSFILYSTYKWNIKTYESEERIILKKLDFKKTELMALKQQFEIINKSNSIDKIIDIENIKNNIFNISGTEILNDIEESLGNKDIYVLNLDWNKGKIILILHYDNYKNINDFIDSLSTKFSRVIRLDDEKSIMKLEIEVENVGQ